MTQDEIIELAIQGHASTRDAIRWAMNQEREACALIADKEVDFWLKTEPLDHLEQALFIAKEIRARGNYQKGQTD
jgi:hypothetical protein